MGPELSRGSVLSTGTACCGIKDAAFIFMRLLHWHRSHISREVSIHSQCYFSSTWAGDVEVDFICYVGLCHSPSAVISVSSNHHCQGDGA